jgi:hypothetical protein
MAKKASKKLSRTTRFFLFGFVPVLILAGGVLFLSFRSYSESKNCGCSPLEKNPTGEFEPQAKIAYCNSRPVRHDFAEISPDPESLALEKGAVLGATTDERWIEIDLSQQRILAHEGNRVVYNFLVSTGKWAPTPTGTFRVWLKLKYTKMSGGSRERRTYYYLPNVPYVMYFHNGYGIHGTYWHQNFGQPMSHGCVNMATPDAEKLFYWASPILSKGRKVTRATSNNPGIKVVVHD